MCGGIKLKNAEKKSMIISLIAGVILVVLEIIMAILTSSQVILVDAVYDSTDIIIVIITMFLIKLYHKPISEKKPFGYLQLESIFILIKSFMLLSVNISIIINAAIVISDGGKLVDIQKIYIFQFVLFILNLIIWLILKKLNKKVMSPTIKMEIISWKSDVFYSIGVTIAFVIANALKGTSFKFILPYFDQIVVIITTIIMFPDLIRVFKENFKSVLLFAPDEDIVKEIKIILNEQLKNTDMKIMHYDIIKTGRKIWISAYFEKSTELLNIKDLEKITTKCLKALDNKIENVYFELVPNFNINIQ